MCRFGTFFVPLLPVFAVFKIFVLYYIKKEITLNWCLPPIRTFKARHNFRFLLNAVSFMALILVLIPLGYTIVRSDTAHPSLHHAFS